MAGLWGYLWVVQTPLTERIPMKMTPVQAHLTAKLLEAGFISEARQVIDLSIEQQLLKDPEYHELVAWVNQETAHMRLAGAGLAEKVVKLAPFVCKFVSKPDKYLLKMADEVELLVKELEAGEKALDADEDIKDRDGTMVDPEWYVKSRAARLASIVMYKTELRDLEGLYQRWKMGGSKYIRTVKKRAKYAQKALKLMEKIRAKEEGGLKKACQEHSNKK